MRFFLTCCLTTALRKVGSSVATKRFTFQGVKYRGMKVICEIDLIDNTAFQEFQRPLFCKLLSVRYNNKKA
jgi:hypothetical protein